MGAPTKSPTPAARALDRATAVLFVAALATPGLLHLARGDASLAVAVENRRVPAPPRLEPASLSSFPRRLEAWYSDVFPGRPQLVRLHARLAWQVLGSSPSPRMLRGRDGWFFNTDLYAMPVTIGARPMSAAELEAWRATLEGRRDWLAERGAEYVFAVAPDKSSIYPELLPARVRPGRTRLDQLVEYLAQTSDVRFVDLRPALLAEKAHDGPRDHVYYPLGTHWTERGAWAAYRALLEVVPELRAGAAPVEREDWTALPRDDPGDDWAERLYLDGLVEQHERRLAWNEEEPARPEPQAGRSPLAVVAFHDSFLLDVRRWLAHHCSSLATRRHLDLDPALIEAERPQLVLQLYGEAILAIAVPSFGEGASGEALRRAFEASTLPLLVPGPDPWPAELRMVDTRPPVPVPGGLDLVLDAPSATLVLPSVAWPADAHAVLRVSLEAEQPGELELRAGAAPDASGERRYLVRSALVPGDNELFIKIWDLAPGEHLLLRFLELDAVRLTALELRAVPREVPDLVPELLGGQDGGR